ncbi:MAG TPA: hypothetical protein VFF73_29755, partial [Planctomycetota bacterium]|nr:hypothetical protein [Planctomycetota bacterium]
QVYLKGTDPSGTITVLVTRNRAPKLQTLAFEASYATAGEVTPQAVLKRVHGILAAPLADDIEKRGLKPTPAQLPADEAAGNVFLSPDGVGTVFPYFYYYARPKALVGILQTVPEVWQGKKKP